MKIRNLTIILCLLFAACGSDLKKENEEDLTKEEVKQRKASGDTKDYCDIFGWYGDGLCDDFCTQFDHDDCNPQCDSFPVCNPGTVEVSECTDPDQCEERSACGSSILCEPDPTCSQAAAAPIACPESYTPGDLCEGLDEQTPCIEIKDTRCGSSVFCNPDPVACSAPLPECGEGFFEVESCKLSDTECIRTIICQREISCAPIRDCRATPTCGPDTEISYASKAECEAGSINCREEYRCGTKRWCGDDGKCNVSDSGCGDSEPAPQCTDPETCRETFGCGNHNICKKTP